MTSIPNFQTHRIPDLLSVAQGMAAVLPSQTNLCEILHHLDLQAIPLRFVLQNLDSFVNFSLRQA